jgi:hypothetical protein
MARDLKYTNNIDAKLLLNLKIKVKKMYNIYVQI